MAITTTPEPPLRTDPQDVFSAKMEAYLVAQRQQAIDFNAAATLAQLATTTTSSSSVAIGTGAKTFTVPSGLGFVVGMSLRIANSSTNYMTGDVTSYSSTTLVVNVTSVVGSGTLASWSISQAAVGANTAGAVSFTPAGNIAATNVQSAIQELDTEKLSSAAGAVTGTNLEDIITAGSVGSVSQIPVITYDANGRITVASSAAKITSGTVVNTTSGTAIDFTSIPSGVKEIVVTLQGVSTNGTTNIKLQLGASGGIEATGYLGATSNASTTANFTDGIGLTVAFAAANVLHGTIIITQHDSATNKWSMSYTGSLSNAATIYLGTSSKTLAGTLDRLRLTANGTDTFDAGTMNIVYK